jgi:RimJ/RimL family protein N-acetyltransferase
MLIDPALISIRDLSEKDIPLILNYWFHSPSGFVEAMGVDLNKLPKESQMEQYLKDTLAKNKELSASKLHALVIEYGGEAVGFHTLNPIIENDYGIFHAHIIKPEMRSKGLAPYTYPMACKRFLKRFNLKRILFKTPIQNTGAIRVKEKLGIRFIGEELVDFGIIKAGTRARVYELTKEEVDTLPTSNEMDVSLIDCNLALSYEERILRHERALVTYNELERAGREMREQLEFDDQSR